MKVLTISLITLILLAALASCNLLDSDGSGNGSDIVKIPYDENTRYIVTVSPEWGLISVISDTDVPVDTVVVLVDGHIIENVDADDGNLVRFAGFYSFEQDETYHIDVTIDGVYHESADVRMVCVPEIAAPEAIQDNVDTEVSWSLEQDAVSQIILFNHYPGGDIQEEPELYYTYIPPSQRSFALAAEEFSFTDESILHIDLEEYNWSVHGVFRFMSFSNVQRDVGTRDQSRHLDPLDFDKFARAILTGVLTSDK